MNDFFPKNELLAGLSESYQKDLRTNIGLDTIIDDLSNNTVTTGALRVGDSFSVNSNEIRLSVGINTSNKFLKSISDDGKAEWSFLPTFDEMLGATTEVITRDLFNHLDELKHLRVESNFKLQGNLDKPSVLLNSNTEGIVTWSALQSEFDLNNTQSNEVPSMLALRGLYNLSWSNDSNLYSDLVEIATDTSLVLTTSNNLSELSNNVADVMSNLGFATNFTTSNIRASNISSSHIDTITLSASNVSGNLFRSMNMIVDEDVDVAGVVHSYSLTTSNITVGDQLICKQINGCNLNVPNIVTSVLESSNITAAHVTLQTIGFDIGGLSNHDVLTVYNSNLTFKTLNSDFSADSEDSIPSSKALNDAIQYMDNRIRTITQDPAFSETYLQINCNLEEIKYYTVEKMLTLHSNLRIQKLAREPTWENLENIPVDLQNLSAFYLTKDLSNIDLGPVNVKKLKDSFQLQDMAYMPKENVDIRGGVVTVTNIHTDNFLLSATENNLEQERINYRDENYLFLRHAGNEGENPSGTGKWGNLPIKQFYDDIGSNSVPSSYALSNLYTYMITGNSNDIGFMNTEYKNQSSHSNAATTKALTDLHDYMRGGFLNPEYKTQSSHSNAATSKALTDLHDFVTSSDENGFLIPFFSNQTSHGHAATAKAVTDLYEHLTEGFLVNDFTKGDDNTAATSSALLGLYQFITSPEHISDDIDENRGDKVVSAQTLSNLYNNLLTSPEFFKTHNPYIFQSYLKQSVNDNSATQPFSSLATSNIIHDMITENKKLYDALSNDGVLDDQINNDDFGRIATSRAIYNLSNNFKSEMNHLNDSIYETETNIGLYNRIQLADSIKNPIDISHSVYSNVILKFKYNEQDFKLNDSGEFSLDGAAISNIASSAIKITASQENNGFPNLIEVDRLRDGEFEINFRGTALLDEISGDVAKSVADAILRYSAGDYTFESNLWVKQNVFVYGDVQGSNANFSNIHVSSDLSAGNLKIYAANLDGSSENNNVYLEANDVDSIIYSMNGQETIDGNVLEIKSNGDVIVLKNEGLLVKDSDGTFRKVALQNQLDLKASQTDVDAALNLKANTEDIAELVEAVAAANGGSANGGSATTFDSNIIKIDSENGRVGIGTTSPQKTLEVAGPMRITDGLSGVCDLSMVQVAGDWDTGTKIHSADKQAADIFGGSVSMNSDGTKVVVGASGEDTGGGNAGAAYIFTYSGGSWDTGTKIQASDKAVVDNFGDSVSMSGDGTKLIVGAPLEDPDGTLGAGSAYIFTYSGGSWDTGTKIQASDKANDDQFGHSVSMSGDGTKVIVGAQFNDPDGTSDAGAAYIFNYNGSSWDPGTKIVASDKEMVEFFGRSVSMSGDGTKVIVGAYNEYTGDMNSDNHGAAYIFTYSGSSWDTGTKIQASDKNAGDYFGVKVAMNSDGTKVIVAAYQQDTGGSSAGAAYVFTYSGGSWDTGTKIQASDKAVGDKFGYSVSMNSDGTKVVAGAYMEDPGGTSDAGSAYIFTYSGGSWDTGTKIQASDKAVGDKFGNSVSMSGDGTKVIVGAQLNHPDGTSDAGAAYIFDSLPPIDNLIVSTGRVGIGTTTPNASLHVVDPTTTVGTRRHGMNVGGMGADIVPMIYAGSGGQNIKTIAGLEITSHDAPNSGHGRHAYIETVSAGSTYNTDMEFRVRNSVENQWGGASINVTVKQARIAHDGIIYARVGTAATGADYAELFEWVDGNSENEDRTGMTVKLMEGGKIAVTDDDTSPNDIIGVISVIYGFLGNNHWDEWVGKYLKDSLGRAVTETVDMVTWRDEDDKELTFTINTIPDDLEVPETATYYQDTGVPKLNPKYDETLEYTERGKRKEWGAVGLVGRLRVLKTYPKSSRWVKLQDIDSQVEEYLAV